MMQRAMSQCAVGLALLGWTHVWMCHVGAVRRGGSWGHLVSGVCGGDRGQGGRYGGCVEDPEGVYRSLEYTRHFQCQLRLTSNGGHEIVLA